MLASDAVQNKEFPGEAIQKTMGGLGVHSKRKHKLSSTQLILRILVELQQSEAVFKLKPGTTPTLLDIFRRCSSICHTT